MQIYIRVKAAGKRRDVLEKVAIDIPDTIDNAEHLITYIVAENVRAYNAKTVDAPLFKYLTQTELEAGQQLGKIGFDDRKNETLQDEATAVANALQCFNDGIYLLLINEKQVENLGGIDLREYDVITFIRLVMLAGRRW